MDKRSTATASSRLFAPRPAPPVGKLSSIGRANQRANDVETPPNSFDALKPFAPPPPGRSLPGQLAVVCCYFNPCGYESQKRNYQRFAAGIREQGVALYTIELAFNDGPFFLPPDDAVVQLRTTHFLWHKERLLNLLIRRLPGRYDKIAWVDADLLFENSRWAEEAARQLERLPVVQLFAEAHYLNSDGRRHDSRIGVACAVLKKSPWARDFGRVHPGFGWAARREVLARHGLFDRNIIGAGDTLMVCGMYGWWSDPFFSRHNDAMLRAFRNWAEPFYRDVGGRVGFVEGSVEHLWHGSRANRKYVERLDCLKEQSFDPQLDIAPGPDGLWKWATHKPALHRAIRRYFEERREDET